MRIATTLGEVARTALSDIQILQAQHLGFLVLLDVPPSTIFGSTAQRPWTCTSRSRSWSRGRRKTRRGGRRPQRRGIRHRAGRRRGGADPGGAALDADRRCRGSAVVAARCLHAGAVAGLSLAEHPSDPPCDAAAPGRPSPVTAAVG